LLQSNGEILVAGGLNSAVNPPPAANDIGFAVARYTPAGSADKTFGTGGAAITDLGSANPLSAALALQSNGDIVAAGIAGQPQGTGQFPPNPTSFALVRYTAAGVLDSTFGVGGIVITPINVGTNSWFSAVTVQTDGKIVAAGTVGYRGQKGFTSEGGYVLRYLGQ
jgi:uncharacterized delta-60 repeat protein